MLAAFREPQSRCRHTMLTLGGQACRTLERPDAQGDALQVRCQQHESPLKRQVLLCMEGAVEAELLQVMVVPEPWRWLPCQVRVFASFLPGLTYVATYLHTMDNIKDANYSLSIYIYRHTKALVAD